MDPRASSVLGGDRGSAQNASLSAQQRSRGCYYAHVRAGIHVVTRGVVREHWSVDDVRMGVRVGTTEKIRPGVRPYGAREMLRRVYGGAEDNRDGTVWTSTVSDLRAESG